MGGGQAAKIEAQAAAGVDLVDVARVAPGEGVQLAIANGGGVAGEAEDEGAAIGSELAHG